MNRTVPWSIKGVGPETRDAAKEAARRSGLSLGAWLDGIIAERASRLGVPTGEIDNGGKVEAVADELARLAGRSPGSEHSGEADGAASAPQEPSGGQGESFGPQETAPQEIATQDSPEIGSMALSAERVPDGNGNPAPDVTDAVQGRDIGWGGIPSAASSSRAETLESDNYDPRQTRKALRALSEKLASFERENWSRALSDASEDPRPSKVDPTNGRGRKAASKIKSANDRSIRNAVAEITRRQAALDAETFSNAGPDHAAMGFVPPDPSPAPFLGMADPLGGPGLLPSRAIQSEASLGDLNEAVFALEARLASGRAVMEDSDRNGIASSGATTPAGDHPKSALEPPGQYLRQAIDSDGLPALGIPPSIGRPRREVRDRSAVTSDRPFGAVGVEPQVAGIDAPALGSVQHRDPGASSTLGEIRALLDRFEPGSTISSLERRMEDLAVRIDRSVGPQSSSRQIEDLARRIDEMHSSIQGQGSSIEPRSVDALVRGIADRIEEASEASADIQRLEGLISSLASKLDGGHAQPDHRAVEALEAQMSRLGDRLERSEASLSALDGVEHSLGELFAQLEHTRNATIDAAEMAARTAARDTLRAAMHNPAVPHGPPDGESGLIGHVTHELSELRVVQDASSRRTQAALMGLHQTMEKLVEHIARLEAVGRPGSGDQWQPADTPGVTPAALVGETARDGGAPAVRAEPALQERVRPGEADRQPADSVDPVDTLIEPGLGRAPVRERTAKPESAARTTLRVSPAGVALPGDERGGPASFIAAARRAAHAAQASAAAAQKPANRVRISGESISTTALSSLERVRNFLVQRRRPMLLSLASLVLLLGAVEVAKLGSSASAPERTGVAETGEPGRLETVSPETGSGSAAARPAVASLASRRDAKADAAAPIGGPAARPVTAAAVDPNGATAVGSIKSGLATRTMNPFLPGSAFPLSGLGEGLRTMALAGNPAAQYEVGLRFSEGRTVGRDMKVAATWFEKAAAQGLAPAQYRLGSAYEKGIGQPRDPALAMAWYGRAAEAGNIRAMHNLAVMAAEGSVGKPDYAKAATWFAKAAALGVRDSQFNLAILYARGLGIEQNLAQSYMWFAIAASQGDDDAAKKRDEVGARLDAKTLETAKAAAESFRPGTAVSAANEIAPPPGGWDAVAPTRSPPSVSKGTPPKVGIM